MTPPNVVSPTGFKYRGAAASVMRRMVAKTGVANLTIRTVAKDGTILYYVVRKDGTGLPRTTALETPIVGTGVVDAPKEHPPKKGFFGSLICSVLRMFR